MAVPKRKTSKSKKNSRRASKKISLPSIHLDKTTGEYVRNHHVSQQGYYNGKKVL
ncbi:50S ribosomal protein L32 [Liquorilactobacillus satsumensis]|uniref:Large ribosomal subunit protein bL32 n=1 Tax=Liquorilactobacillus satsumensis DSM 16230 = JCM 12392 TaxID=1423801 RepID=A0A0R1UYW0_9LACO|nr:50S ribosomal protein L32 [Liquorilactobacillus satsumensis]KRL98496.1 hypothetical protein FD50_GL000812 [Liquorilactobacillus satsumensis DSM 16230 = JCM 12392]MCC7666022.1 50S ribosomal protein L32 [Liquorilactobacillus satsumensis]MCP9313076.1 50S ribosomal protein L32 [Liquorilactobacillus satsumensis]MCP9329351.1 50S ribosomal protein L32 [Liquorilactobacillus satsumensis]MCP9356873.1 50S ribosomal protein L32 [Liquorilactobacillus satsumensis]